MIRRSWAHVTLAEYATIGLLTDPDAIEVMNAYWDYIHEHNPFRGEEPTRLNEIGLTWWTLVTTKYATADDEAIQQQVARDELAELGTLMVVNCDRIRQRRRAGRVPA